MSANVGYTKAPKDNYCIDVWTGWKLDERRTRIYLEMRDRSEIQITSIQYDKKRGVAVFEYNSAAPHEWVLDEMHKEAVRTEQEQQKLF